MTFDKELKELEQRHAKALEMGGAEKIQKQHCKGKLSARERIDQLLDAGSFVEVGMFNHSDMPGMEAKTPADSKIAGYDKIDDRQVFHTSAASGQKNGQPDPKKKLRHFGVGSATVPTNTGGHGGLPYCANLALFHKRQ